ncbi:MAG: hypothetical protein WCP12_10400 [bacterium]
MTSIAVAEPKQISGIYPHLTTYNNEGECGTGAAVPWADRLWVISYGPHLPMGSSDKLYEITPSLEQIIRLESVGGTPANRMIHKESNQLNIGPYLIDKDRNVRVLKPKQMPGRLTGTARHLIDPANKIYIATMEEGLYSVDVKTLEVEEHIKDGNGQPKVGKGISSELTGYHGKGLYSGQGFLMYANNGTRGKDATVRPDIPSGALAYWQGAGDWKLIRQNQFTEITGPGGIYGNEHPESDPVWSMGWDYRSLILMLLENKQWHAYRLPKGSHSYDGAHGWNTEWPRIREIGEKNLLATMHGTFWSFPSMFSLANSAGIAPRSNYLKVIGDFARWNDRVVFGCDDSAKSEFLNSRPFKCAKGAPVQSNSNIWFVEPERLDHLGPAIGRGSVWLRDDLKAGQVSEPYLFAGYDYRMMTIKHGNPKAVTFTLEVDRKGNNQWEKLDSLKVDGALVHIFKDSEKGAWVRVSVDADVKEASVHFNYRNKDQRTPKNGDVFNVLAQVGEKQKSKGVIRSNRKVLSMISDDRYYELNDKLELTPKTDSARKAMVMQGAQSASRIRVDGASVIVEEAGMAYRIPKNPLYETSVSTLEFARVCREVATERDLFNFHGTFYELPARNAQGFAKIRPIATHNLQIHDYASHFGMLFMTGLNGQANDRVVKSADGATALWAGVIDDLWQLGKPRGEGGVWKDSAVKANVPSDPYLMTGYDKKSVTLQSSVGAQITLEIDIDGTGLWMPYKTVTLKAGEPVRYDFPEGFSAYWVRAVSSADATATVMFKYE